MIEIEQAEGTVCLRWRSRRSADTPLTRRLTKVAALECGPRSVPAKRGPLIAQHQPRDAEQKL